MSGKYVCFVWIQTIKFQLLVFSLASLLEANNNDETILSQVPMTLPTLKKKFVMNRNDDNELNDANNIWFSRFRIKCMGVGKNENTNRD